MVGFVAELVGHTADEVRAQGPAYLPAFLMTFAALVDERLAELGEAPVGLPPAFVAKLVADVTRGLSAAPGRTPVAGPPD